jgi:hypothetical protein
MDRGAELVDLRMAKGLGPSFTALTDLDHFSTPFPGVSGRFHIAIAPFRRNNTHTQANSAGGDSTLKWKSSSM